MSKTYEMMWNCEFCGSAKLLGKSHRYCPNCGAAQDPDSRYFPPEEEKIAVEDHEFVGADKVCASCDAPNSSKSEYCANCGGPMDDAKGVQLQTEAEEPSDTSPAPSPSETSKSSSKMPLIIGALVVLVLVCAGLFLIKETKDVVVKGHSWERTIDIERYQTVEEKNWKDKVPIKGVVKRCIEKQRSTKKVEDGQECKTVKKDNGDGTYNESEKCTTKYKEIPVNDQWCTYKIDKWKLQKTEKASGVDFNPIWPTVSVKTCTLTNVGCEREGAKKETYTVNFTDPEGEVHGCDFPMEKWKSIAVGSKKQMDFNLVGSIDCGSFDDKP